MRTRTTGDWFCVRVSLLPSETVLRKRAVFSVGPDRFGKNGNVPLLPGKLHFSTSRFIYTPNRRTGIRALEIPLADVMNVEIVSVSSKLSDKAIHIEIPTGYKRFVVPVITANVAQEIRDHVAEHKPLSNRATRRARRPGFR